MTENYIFTDNPIETGSVCDTDIANDAIMYLRYQHTTGIDPVYDIVTQDLDIGTITEIPSEDTNTAYISNITKGNLTALISGDNFDGNFVPTDFPIIVSATLSAHTYNHYSLASYLPNDNYDYLVAFSGRSSSLATSGRATEMMLISGTNNTETTSYSLGEAVARTAAAQTTGGSAILPIFATDRNITVYITDSYNSNYCFLDAIGYVRVGKND